MNFIRSQIFNELWIISKLRTGFCYFNFTFSWVTSILYQIFDGYVLLMVYSIYPGHIGWVEDFFLLHDLYSTRRFSLVHNYGHKQLSKRKYNSTHNDHHKLHHTYLNYITAYLKNYEFFMMHRMTKDAGDA